MTSDMTSDAWIITGPAVISSSLSSSLLVDLYATVGLTTDV